MRLGRMGLPNIGFLGALLLLAASSLAVLLAHAQCSSEDDPIEWTGSAVLNADAEYTVHYKVQGDNLLVKLRAKVTGFLGFGLSEAGHMLGSDIVTVAIVDGQPRVEDRFAEWTAYSETTGLSITEPPVDGCQQWSAVCGEENNGYTTVVLQRPLISPDVQDRNITDADQNVIFAWSTSDTVSYHGPRRGSTVLNFYRASAISAEFSPPNDTTSTMDLLFNNYITNGLKTSYVVQAYDLGSDPQHIVGVEMIIRPEDADLLHHVLLHDCGQGEAAAEALLDKPMFTGTLSPLGVGPCTNLVYGWAKGGGGIAFPSAAGVRTGDGAARYVVLEMHLNDVGRTAGRTVASGVRLYISSTLRQHDIGTIVLGNSGANLPTLPRGQPRVHQEATCPTECLEKLTGNITLFRSFPHMHSYGREIWTTLHRNGEPSRVLSSKQYWNFDFQTQIPLDLELTQFDSLSTHCVYDTSKAENDVKFGADSSEEMCMDFVQYYPKSNFNGLQCGRSGAQTVCVSSMLPVSNPIPDGDTSIPESVSVGGPSSCTVADADEPEKPGNAQPGSAVSSSQLSLFLTWMMLIGTMWAI